MLFAGGAVASPAVRHAEGKAITTVVHAVTGGHAVGAVSAAQVNHAASALGISPKIVQAQLNMESGGDPSAVSPAGAQGVAQFMPGTWSGQGCAGSPFNVGDSLTCYVKYMKELLRQFGGNIRNALAAYNAGPGNLSAGYGYADSILSAARQ